jgi:hypothetical protein
VIGFGLINQPAQLSNRFGQIALLYVCTGEPPPALPRSEAITDRVGKVASFFGGRPHRVGVAGDESHLSLLAEDVVQPPLVS